MPSRRWKVKAILQVHRWDNNSPETYRGHFDRSLGSTRAKITREG